MIFNAYSVNLKGSSQQVGIKLWKKGKELIFEEKASI